MESPLPGRLSMLQSEPGAEPYKDQAAACLHGRLIPPPGEECPEPVNQQDEGGKPENSQSDMDTRQEQRFREWISGPYELGQK